MFIMDRYSGNDYRVATYQTTTGIPMQSLKLIGQFYMPKLTKKAI